MPRRTYQNPLSRFGAAMAIAVFIVDAFFLALDYFGVRLNPIIGIISYTLLPALLFLYLFLIPIGMYREWRRQRRHVGEEAPRYQECNLCHLFLSEELSGVVTAETNIGRPFEHPVDVGGAERTTGCTGCHANY